MIPAWLQRTRGETTRAATLRLCRDCTAPTLVGLDADICALTVRVDPTPLTPIGETIALLSGRRTFDLIKTRRRIEIDYRYEHNIIGSKKTIVVAEHRCGQPLNEHRQPESENNRREPLPERPPF